MSVSSIGSVTTTSASTKPAPDGDSPAVEAAESKKTKAGRANGGIAPKKAPTAGKQNVFKH